MLLLYLFYLLLEFFFARPTPSPPVRHDLLLPNGILIRCDPPQVPQASPIGCIEP